MKKGYNKVRDVNLSGPELCLTIMRDFPKIHDDSSSDIMYNLKVSQQIKNCDNDKLNMLSNN